MWVQCGKAERGVISCHSVLSLLDFVFLLLSQCQRNKVRLRANKSFWENGCYSNFIATIKEQTIQSEGVGSETALRGTPPSFETRLSAVTQHLGFVTVFQAQPFVKVFDLPWKSDSRGAGVGCGREEVGWRIAERLEKYDKYRRMTFKKGGGGRVELK